MEVQTVCLPACEQEKVLVVGVVSYFLHGFFNSVIKVSLVYSAVFYHCNIASRLFFFYWPIGRAVTHSYLEWKVLSFESRAGQIGHSVANGLLLIRNLFEKSCDAFWRRYVHHQLVTHST